MEQVDQRAPTQKHFNHFDQSLYSNESFSDVSESFTVSTDAHYRRYVSSMLFECMYEDVIKKTYTVLQTFPIDESASYKLQLCFCTDWRPVCSFTMYWTCNDAYK